MTADPRLQELAQRTPNFGFLLEHEAVLVGYGAAAESMVFTDANTSMIKTRQFGEQGALRLIWLLSELVWIMAADDKLVTAHQEHYAFAERLAAMARRLQARAAHVGLVIDGEIAIAADQNVHREAGTGPSPGSVSNVYELRYRVLRDRLNQMVATTKPPPHDECVRLALLCLALLDRHTVDGKGRCRYCRKPRSWWRGQSCRCTVVPMMSLFLQQPREFLNWFMK